MTDDILSLLRCETERELLENILPFWMERAIDPLRGGFLGRIDGTGNADVSADKGAVLNSRILWTFSAAYRRWPRSEFLEAARRAGSYLANHFVDPRYGGIFWSVSADGEPAVRKSRSTPRLLPFTVFRNISGRPGTIRPGSLLDPFSCCWSDTPGIPSSADIAKPSRRSGRRSKTCA